KNEQILRRWFKHFGFDWKEQHVRAALWICAVVFVGLGLLSSVKLFQQPEAAADHSSSENRASATTQNIHLLAPSGNRGEGASGHYEPFDLIHSEEVQLEQAIE